jgi:hypothetical protein
MREYLWGAVLFAVLAGYTHYRAGWWLVRRDPDRRRGLTLALLHSGYGLLNGSLLGLIFVFLLLVGAMMDLDGGARAWILGIVAWCVLAVLSALVSAAGFLLAITRRQSIWLDSAPRSIVRSTQWPPTCEDAGEADREARRIRNNAGFVRCAGGMAEAAGIGMARLRGGNSGRSDPRNAHGIAFLCRWTLGGCSSP